MAPFKLINMTKIFDIIHLNNHMYMVDKEAGILNGDWICDRNKFIDHIQVVHKRQREFVMDAGAEDCYKIVASNDKSLGLPLLPEIEENIKQLAKEKFPEGDRTSDNRRDYTCYDKQKGFIAGYKAAKTKQYTEEDMINFLRWLKPKLAYNTETNKFHVDVDGTGKSSDRKVNSEQITKSYLKSLKPLPKQVEVEMDFDLKFIKTGQCMGGEVEGYNEFINHRPKVLNNIIQIVKWIYE